MREIRFRVWDGHKMNYDGLFDLGFGDYGSVLISLWGNVAVYEDDDGGKSGIHEHVVDGYSLNLMQYTGLKDKNGVEIYEGDILSSPWWDIAIVTWFDEYAYFGYEIPARGLVDGFDGDEMNMQVIGNIHESPELLEVK